MRVIELLSAQKITKLLLEPIRLSCILSIVLSITAILSDAVIGRDAALYLHIAEQVNTNGFATAFKTFNWPWYSILIAYLHKLTGLSYEMAACLYSVTLMAGTTALIVSMVKKVRPETSYWAVLIVLSIPAFNIFRDDLLRDIGFWFFVTLTLWLVLVNAKSIGFFQGIFIQLSTVSAMLFRLEAAFLLLSLALFLMFLDREVYFKSRLLNLLKAYSLYLSALLAVFIFSVSYDWYSHPRVANYISMIQPIKFYDTFMAKSDQFAHIALKKWSYSDAPMIFLSGMFFALCMNIFKYGGIASLLLIPSKSRMAMFKSLSDFKLHAVSAILFFLILYIFYVERGFMNSRYASLLLLLLVPFFAAAAKAFFTDRKKLAAIFVVFSLIMAVSNVVSTSSDKTYFFDASKWVKDHTSEQDRIYYDEGRIAYYAGRGYPTFGRTARNLEHDNLDELKTYQYFVVTLRANDNEKLEGITKRGFTSVYSVGNKKKVIHIFTHKE